MNAMRKLLNDYARDTSGATAIEYGLIAALIAVGMIVGATAVGEKVNAKFDEVATEMDKASAGSAGGTAP